MYIPSKQKDVMRQKEIKPTAVRSHRIALRVSPEEHRKIKSFCQDHQVTFSDFVRQAIGAIDMNLIPGR